MQVNTEIGPLKFPYVPQSGYDLFGAQEGVAEEEEYAEDPDEGADFVAAAGAEFDEGEGEQAEAEAGGDAERQGRGYEREERGEGFAEIVPTNARHGATHERANENERGSRSVSRNRGDQRRAKHRDKKECGDDGVAEAGAGSSSDSGGAFDVARDGGRSGERAEHGAEGVREQRAARAQKFPVAQKAAFFADADQSAHIVEKIHEENDENQFAETDTCGGAQVELEERAGGMRQGEKMCGPVTEAERNAGERDDDDSEENGAADAPGHQDGDENESSGCEKNLGIGNFAQPDEGGGISHNDIRVAQSNERDK